MLSNLKQSILLVLLIFFAGSLYLWNLENVPPSLYADETTVGYNAYSILKTGKDEYGKEYPVFFRLFGAYTPSLFVYTLVPFVKILGLNALSLRLPSVLATIALIPILYFFVKKLKIFQNQYSPFLASLLFSITPWVVFNARLGYEVTLGYVLFYFGVFLLWVGLDKSKLSLLGLLFLSLATYTAHTQRYLVPLFLLLFFILFKKQIFHKKNTNQIITAATICLVTQIPHFALITSPAFWVKNTSFAANSLQTGVLDFIGQLIVYFSPHTYFGRSTADINLQHYMPEISLFYSWQIIPFLIGLYFLLKNINTTNGKLIIMLLITAPLPGAMSGHFVSFQRVLPIIIPIILIITLGLEKILNAYTKVLLITLTLLLPFSLLMFWRSYFVFLPGLWSGWWNFGSQELASIISQNKQTNFVIDNSRDQALYSPLIFYLQYSPEEFQKQFSNVVKNYYDNPPYSSVVSFGNVITRPINWETDPLTDLFLVGDTLAVSNDQAREHFLTPVTSIKDKNGKTHFNIFKTNPILKKQDTAKKQQRHYN